MKIIRRRITTKKREAARIFVENRLSYFNKIYNFEINRVAIKNTTARWGSCSSKRNLNFNYKIVHELCHLGELNHSKRFWALVRKAIPDYDKINNELKKTNIRLM